MRGSGQMTSRLKVDTGVATREAVALAPNRMLVPLAPGRLVPIDQRSERPRDDLDEMVDELFGEPADVSPGPLDAVLVVLGTAILAWWLITGQSAVVFILGVGVLLLGLVIPVRTVRQRLQQRRVARKQHALVASHQVLDATDPVVNDLTTAYAELVAASKLPATAHGSEALAAGYLAITEVTSLLDGRSPIVPEEIEYIKKRTAAVRGLAKELEQSHTASVDSERQRIAQDEQERKLRASAGATVREDLDAYDRSDSLDRLGTLTQRVRAENHDAGS